MNVQKRLKDFIKYLNISERDFCQSIGVSHAYVSNVKSKINASTREAMERAYPSLNIEWVLTGRGAMLLDEPRVFEEVVREKSVEIPRVPAVNDMAGRLLALVESQQKTIAEQAATISRQAATIEKLAEGSKKVSVEAPGILAPAGVD